MSRRWDMEAFRLTPDDVKWLFASFAFVSLSIFFSYFIFPGHASILTISFVVIALTPYVYGMMESEEVIVAHSKLSFLRRYDDIIARMLLISAGLFLAFSFWYAALPSDPLFNGVCSTGAPCREGVFQLQQAYFEQGRELQTIFGLLAMSFALSLFLGVGAMLIIIWDLSSLVVGSSLGPVSFITYLPQLLAFFLTGLAGALLSFAIMKHEWRSHSFLLVLRDSSALLVISVALAAVYPLVSSP